MLNNTKKTTRKKKWNNGKQVSDRAKVCNNTIQRVNDFVVNAI